MSDTANWARGSNQYKKMPGQRLSSNQIPEISLGLSGPSISDQRELTGITWDPSKLNFDLIKKTTPDRARARFRAVLPEYIWDAAALEGNPYTLPEVRTLLEGMTVDRQRLADQNQILAINDAYNFLDQIVGDETFALDKATSDEVHLKVAIHEALESGHFRGEGTSTGGGTVSLGAAGTFRASEPGAGGSTLINQHQDLMDFLETVQDPRERAIAYFASATLRQFYWDGNKRTSRTMMTGELMSHGFDAISISFNRKLEFNEYLTELFLTQDATSLMRFIIDSRPE